jgi:hypothetical protein
MSEGSLVLELQRLAQLTETGMTELLRRAKVVSAKLDLEDALSWIEHESGGYPPGAELPPYRLVPSELRVRNPFHGWQPVRWDGANPLQEHFAEAKILLPIVEIEALLAGSGALQSAITQEECDLLVELGNCDFNQLPAARFYGRGSFVGILEGVRARILDWSLALEKQGVVGRGMTFAQAEVQSASKVVLRVDGASALVLFLSANPDDSSPLDVEQEQKRIVTVRDGSRHQDKARIEGLPDLDLPALAKSLRLHRPTAIHFCGHGDDTGALVMRDEHGSPFEMHPDGLAKLLSFQKDTTRIVVLSACYSDMLAARLVHDIECVVGMRDTVSDAAAILFAQTFYGALFDGETVARAFETAAAAVQARYNDEKETPILRCKDGVDPADVRLFE